MKKLILILAFLLACFECEPNPKYQTAGWGALAAAAISAGAAIYGNHQRNEAQERENQKAFERERQQVAEMNAYNSASAQAARLRAAGLNPNVMYDSGPAAAAGEQSDIAHYQPADVTNAFGDVGAEAGNLVNSLVGIREQENKNMLAKSQLELNSANKDLAFANVEKTNAEATRCIELLGYEKDNLAAAAENEHTSAQLNREKRTTEQILQREKEENIKLIREKVEVSEEQEKYYRELAFKASAETMAVIELLPDQKSFMRASAAERMAMVTRAAYECREIQARESLEYAQRRGVKAEIEKAEAYIRRLDNMTINDYINTATNGIYRIASAVGQFYNPMGSMASTFGSVAGGVLNNPTGSSMVPNYGAAGSIMGIDYY